jgi:hypothetical protein
MMNYEKLTNHPLTPLDPGVVPVSAWRRDPGTDPPAVNVRGGIAFTGS